MANNGLNAKEISSDFSPIGDKNEAKFAISSQDVDRVVEIILQKITKKIQ